MSLSVFRLAQKRSLWCPKHTPYLVCQTLHYLPCPSGPKGTTDLGQLHGRSHRLCGIPFSTSDAFFRCRPPVHTNHRRIPDASPPLRQFHSLSSREFRRSGAMRLPAHLVSGSVGELHDFRSMLDTVVRESIEHEDMATRVGQIESELREDDDDGIAISTSGKTVMCPWRLRSDQVASSSDQLEAGNVKTDVSSVTAVLQKTMPAESAMALLRWESLMIDKMGNAGFQKLKKEMFAEGRQLHANIGSALLQKPEELEIAQGIKGYWRSIKDFLPLIESDSPILECYVRHPRLSYHGYVDCITEYKGKPCVIEFKTSRKPKKTLRKCFDSPLQAVAYVGAFNFDPRYKTQVDQAILAIAYRDGSPADIHVMNSDLCGAYWKRWMGRLQEYREFKDRQAAKEI